MKVCSKCGEEKPDAEFVWDDGILLGEGKRCRECRADRARHCPDCRGQHRCVAHRGTQWPGPVHEYVAMRYPVKAHALARFWERVRPDIEKYAVTRVEMARMMEDAPLSMVPQEWYDEKNPPGDEAPFKRGYLHVADGVMFALADYRGNGVMVSTVLTRDGLETPEAVPMPKWVASIHDGTAKRIVANQRRRERRARACST